jgi:hypothetical protein
MCSSGMKVLMKDRLDKELKIVFDEFHRYYKQNLLWDFSA